MCSSCSSWCSTPLAWRFNLLADLLFCSSPLVWFVAPLFFVSSFLFFDLLFCSFCSTYCFAFLAQHVVPFILFNLLFHSSCLTCCSAPFTQPTTLFFLLNLLFCSFFNLLLRSTYCSALLARPLYSSTFLLCPWFCYSTFLVRPLYSKYLFAMLVILLLLVPFAQHCCSISFVWNWYFPPPLYFFASVECGRVD